MRVSQRACPAPALGDGLQQLEAHRTVADRAQTVDVHLSEVVQRSSVGLVPGEGEVL